MDSWEKLKTLSTVLSVVVIPVALGIIGNQYTKSMKEREIQHKFVEMAINILNEKPTADNRNLRDWATKVIDKYSGVPMTEEARKDLIDRITITKVEGVSNRLFRETQTDREINRIILCDTHSPNGDALIKAFKSGVGVSGTYHYIIDKAGKISNLVPEKNIAYHSKKHSNDSIGIGLVHIPQKSPFLQNSKINYEEYSEAQLKSLTNLLADITNRYNIDINSIIPNAEIIPHKISDMTDRIHEIRKMVKKKTN